MNPGKTQYFPATHPSHQLPGPPLVNTAPVCDLEQAPTLGGLGRQVARLRREKALLPLESDSPKPGTLVGGPPPPSSLPWHLCEVQTS